LRFRKIWLSPTDIIAKYVKKSPRAKNATPKKFRTVGVMLSSFSAIGETFAAKAYSAVKNVRRNLLAMRYVKIPIPTRPSNKDVTKNGIMKSPSMPFLKAKDLYFIIV
jgi:hypothetical protein